MPPPDPHRRQESLLLATSLTGPNAVLTPAQGTDVAVRQDVIQLTQADGASAVTLNEAGHLLVTQSIRRDDDWRVGIPAMIEEDVAERLTGRSASRSRCSTMSIHCNGSATSPSSPRSTELGTRHGALGKSTPAARTPPR
jgi:hypothetical protein